MDSFIENFNRYKENKHFYATREINFKLLREGNANNLDENLCVPLRPMQQYITYSNNKKLDIENGKIIIGPLVTINTIGNVTEGDASTINQNTIYNYGNILEDSIENIILKNNGIIIKPKKFFRVTNKTLKKYQTYNK